MNSLSYNTMFFFLRRRSSILMYFLIGRFSWLKVRSSKSTIFLKQKICLSSSALQKNNILRHTISNPKEGYFSSLQFNRSVHIDKMVQISSSGDFIKSSPSGRIGIMFIRADSKRELNNLYEVTLNRKLYSIL